MMVFSNAISFWLLQSEMGLATEQLSQQLLEYEKKVSIDAMMELMPEVDLWLTGMSLIIRLLSLNFSKNNCLLPTSVCST